MNTSVMSVTPDLPEFEIDDWRVERFTVDEHGYQMSVIAYGHRRAVPVGEYTRLVRKGSRFNDPMMSDTPAELLDHLWALRSATGRVLINGLGLGCLLKGILTKPDVTHVDVVEIDEGLVEKMIEVAPWCQDERVNIYVHDALTMKWPVGTRWDYAWHDIWPTINEDNLPEYARLNRMYGTRVDRQDAWAHELIKEQRRDRGWW